MQDQNITRDLNRLLDARTLSPRLTTQVEAIYDALTRPKRVTIMGPPKSGKSDLIALLAGNRIVEADVPLGTIHFIHGEQVQSSVTMLDGSTQEMDGVPTAATFSADAVPVETTIVAPVPALKKISLTRLVEANSFDDQIKAMTLAASKSDVVIWCTNRFSSVEKKMWAQMPERVRDNAIVLRTSLVAFNHNIDTARSDLGRRVGDEFAFVFAADLKVALNAQGSDPIDIKGMKKSGAPTVISTLLKEIEQGRENAAHKAELILAKYPGHEETMTKEAEEALHVGDSELTEPKPETQKVAEAPVKSSPAPQSREETPNKEKSTETNGDPDGVKVEIPLKPERTLTAKSPKPASKGENDLDFKSSLTESKVVAAAPTSSQEAEGDGLPALSNETVTIFQSMIVQLSQLGVPDTDTDGHSALFDTGQKTLSWMDEELKKVANDDVPRVARLQQMTQEATDHVSRLRQRENDKSALNAVTVWLQIKRDIGALLAS